MTAGLTAPSCEVTGQPLPVLPARLRENGVFFNYDHLRFPSTAPELQGLAGRAVRCSSGQLIDYGSHKRKHKVFSQSDLPQTAEEAFRATVFACAGIVPRQAIDFSQKGEYEIVDLSNQQFEQIAHPRSIYIEGTHNPGRAKYVRKEIGRFFAYYALNQEMRDSLSESVIGEFLDNKTETDRKKELGNFILREAMGMSIDDLVPTHRTLKKEGYVAKNKDLGLFTVMRKFFTKNYFPDYHEEVAKRLALNP